jgi:hypothetical protein
MPIALCAVAIRRISTVSYLDHRHVRYRTRPGRGHQHEAEQGFICIQCQQYVSCDPGSAGVQNRNHCPACLWSRHLDWRSAGDRLSVCRAAMQPIGLTTKRSRNKYATERDGELMIVHQCSACETVIINRIAADDSATSLLALYDRSHTLGAAFQAELASSGIVVLTAADGELVQRRLFGNRFEDIDYRT